jgi:hypothetical protein
LSKSNRGFEVRMFLRAPVANLAHQKGACIQIPKQARRKQMILTIKSSSQTKHEAMRNRRTSENTMEVKVTHMSSLNSVDHP